MSWRQDAILDIRFAEGLRLCAYQDGEGVWTIGYGHTAGVKEFDTCGLEQAIAWLMSDVFVAEGDLDRNVPWWGSAPDQIRRGLLNMSFALGWPRLSGFKLMLKAGASGNWELMAQQVLDSKWAGQVGNRARNIAQLFRVAVSARVA